MSDIEEQPRPLPSTGGRGASLQTSSTTHSSRFASVLRDLERDPFQPHLKFHNLTGKLKGMQAVSITHSYRITLTVLVTEKEIILLSREPGKPTDHK